MKQAKESDKSISGNEEKAKSQIGRKPSEGSTKKKFRWVKNTRKMANDQVKRIEERTRRKRSGSLVGERENSMR
jgi:hypothetical protein